MPATIGRAGICQLAGMQVEALLDASTPFGSHSGAIVKGTMGRRLLLFLVRHGSGRR